MTLVLAFSRGTDLIDRLIGWLTYSSVTHVALVRGQRVIESSGHGYPKGVREVSLWDWLERHPNHEMREVEHPSPDTVWEIAQSQLGKGGAAATCWAKTEKPKSRAGAGMTKNSC